jgi:TP901 family phage tail tape measure protein
LKVGDLTAELRLVDSTYRSQLKQIQAITNQVTAGMSRAMQANLKSAFKGLPQAANAASKQAATQIKTNLQNSTKGIDFGKGIKGLNFGFDFAGLNSITTGFNAAGIAAGFFGSAIGKAMNLAKDAIAGVISEGMAFTEQMSTVTSIVATDMVEISGGTIQYSEQAKAAMKALEDQAISLGSTTSFTATEVGQAQELLARAGFSVNETLSATPGLLAAAAAEGLDLATTADISASALRGFGLEASQMDMVANLLAATSATSNASIRTLGQSFKYIAPVAQTLNLDITDVNAALGMLANMGIKGSMAGRNLASGLMFLAKPSEKAKNLIDQLGISISDAEGNFKQLPDILAEVSKATTGYTDEQALANLTLLVGKDNAKTYLGMLNATYKTVEDGKEVTLSGAEAMQVYSDALAGMPDAAEKMAKLRLDNLSGDMEMLKGAASSLGISLFREAEPALRKFVQGGTALIQQLTPVFIQTFGTIRSVIGQIVSNVMPGLLQAWQNLQPAIAALGPIIQRALGFLAGIAVEAAKWGGQIVAQLAAGMSAAIQRVVAVLKYIGSIIAYWLRPNSPPKIVPDLDQYGTEAGQLYIDSFGNADVAGPLGSFGSEIQSELQSVTGDVAAAAEQAGADVSSAFVSGMAGWDTGSFDLFNSLTDEIETSIRALGESGSVAKDAVVPAILDSRNAVQEFVNSLRETGTVSEESIGSLLSTLGPVGGEVEGLVRAYANLVTANQDLAEATEEVARAQEEVNRITEEYDRILSPLQGRLGEINAEQQRIKDMQRIQKLQEEIASGKLDENEIALAQLEIEEIGLNQQIDATEQERDIALEAAEEKLKAAEDAQKVAEENQKAVEAQYNAAQAQISATRENNSLMQEQVKILEEIAKAQEEAAKAASGGGGLGGGLGGIGGGGMPDLGMPEFDPEEVFPPGFAEGFDELETALTDLTGPISDFSQGFEDAKTALAGFFGGIPESVSPARESLDTFFNTPLGTALSDGAGVVAGYFKNDFPKELGEGIGVAQGWLAKIDKSEFGQSLRRGASVVADYFVNDWPPQFQRGTQAVAIIMAPFVTDFNKRLGDMGKVLTLVADYFLNDWPEQFRRGFEKVSGWFSTFKDEIETSASSYMEPAKSIGQNVIAGIIRGLDAASGGLFSALAGIVKTALGEAQKAAKIKSPSRLFADEVGLPLVQGIVMGIDRGSIYVKKSIHAINTDILTAFVALREGVLEAFGELGELMKEQAEAIMNDLDSLEIIEGMLPDDDDVINAAEKFDDIVEALEKNKDKLLSIDEELEEERKKINAEMIEEQEKAGKKLTELRTEQAELDQQIADVMAGKFKDKRDQDDMKAIDKEREKIAKLIENLQAGPQTDINRQRLAELQARDQELAGKRQEIIDENLNDLLEDRADVAEEISEIELETEERLAKLRQELIEAETEADSDRAEALREQIRLTEELAAARNEFNNQQNLFNQLQQIADLTKQALEQAKQAVAPLAELDPSRANRFFNQYQDSIDQLYDLEQKLKEEAFGENDPRRIQLLKDQIELVKQASKAEFEALKQQEREKINDEIAKGGELTAELTELQKRLAEEEDTDRRIKLQEEIKAQEEEIRLFNLRLPLLREQLALIDQLKAYELNTSNLPAPSTYLGDVLPLVEEVLRSLGINVGDIAPIRSPYAGGGAPGIGIPGDGGTATTSRIDQYIYNLVGNYQMRSGGLSLMDEVRLQQLMRRGAV